MATIKHSFTSALADDVTAAAKGEVLPSHWNASHVDSSGNPLTLRTVLIANINYYVATTGSDSNPGTSLLPWATMQHAMHVIASALDIAGFPITVNIGVGTFVGFGIESTVGGGIVQFLGAGSTTIIQDGANDGIFNFGDCITINVQTSSTVAIDMVKFAPQLGNTILRVFAPIDFYFGNLVSFSGGTITTDLTNAFEFLRVDAPAVGIVMGISSAAFSFIGGGASMDSLFVCKHGDVTFNGGTYTHSGALTLTDSYIAAGANGFFDFDTVPTFTVTGSVMGPRFDIFDSTGKILITGGDPAGTLFPGTTKGTIALGGVYSGITDFIGIVSSLPTANIEGTYGVVTDALTATFGSAPTGGHATVVPVYNNGTAWLMG